MRLWQEYAADERLIYEIKCQAPHERNHEAMHTALPIRDKPIRLCTCITRCYYLMPFLSQHASSGLS